MGKRRSKKNLNKVVFPDEKTKGDSTGFNDGTGGSSDGLKLWRQIGLVLVFNLIIFSSLSYTLWIPVYVAVPFFAAFISAFLLPPHKKSAVIVVTAAVAGSLIFAAGPSDPVELSTPHLVIKHLLSQRQAQMLLYTPPVIPGLLGGILGWGISVLARSSKFWTKTSSWVLLVLFCINFAGISMDLNPAVVDRALKKPVAGEYNNFNSVNLLTFYKMKEGMGFYQAYSQAFSGRAETPGQLPGQIWSWRMPGIFYLWKTLLPPDGFYVMYLYLIFGVLIFYMIFNMASSYLPPPLNLVAVMAAAYPFVYGGVAYWFTFPEFWGMAFFLLGIWGLFRNNFWAALAGFAIAPLIREFYLICWAGVLLVMILNREPIKKILLMTIPGVIFSMGFFLHYRAIEGIQKAKMPDPAMWFMGKPAHLLEIMSFGSVLLSGGAFIVGFMAVIFLIGLYFNRNRRDLAALSAAALLPALLFLKIGPGTERIYWGAVVLPLMMSAAVMGLGPLIDKQEIQNGKEENSILDVSGTEKGEMGEGPVNHNNGEDGIYK